MGPLVEVALAAILGLAVVLGGPPIARAEETPGTLAGTVYLDPKGTGKPTGDGVANVEVIATAGGKTDARRSGPDGSFSFQLAPGRYTVRVSPPGDYRITSDAELSVVVTSRKTTGGVAFGLAPKPKPTTTPTPKPAPPTATPKPGESPPVQSAEARSPTASPSPVILFSPPSLFPSPSPSESGAESAVAGREPRATPTSGEDILAGRGVHWRLLGEGQALTVDPMAAAERTRPVVTSLEALRRVSVSQLQSWGDDTTLWLGVPFRTQLDGTEFSRVNCGPTSLAMVLAAFGLEVGPASIRDYVNYLTGHYDPEEGTSLDVLASVASQAGLTTFGLYGGGGYRAWTVDDIRQHVRAGHPVVTLVKYRSLPGNGATLAEWDHYIVITGLAGEDLIYNDSAFSSDYGFNLLISPGDLKRAWSFSSLPRHALAIGLGDSLRPLPNAPPINAANLALGPEARVEPPLAMIPGAAALWLREQMLADSGARTAGQPARAAPARERAELLNAVREPSASEAAARPAAPGGVETAAAPPAPISPESAILPPGAVPAPPRSPDGPATTLAIYAVLLVIFAETLRRHRMALVLAGAELRGSAGAMAARMPAVGPLLTPLWESAAVRAAIDMMRRAWVWLLARLAPLDPVVRQVERAVQPVHGWVVGVARSVRVLLGRLSRFFTSRMVLPLLVIPSAARDLLEALSRVSRSLAALGMTETGRLARSATMTRLIAVVCAAAAVCAVSMTYGGGRVRRTLARLTPTPDRLAAIDERISTSASGLATHAKRFAPRRPSLRLFRASRHRRIQAVRGRARAIRLWRRLRSGRILPAGWVQAPTPPSDEGQSIGS